MKKLLALLVAVLMLVGVCGCLAACEPAKGPEQSTNESTQGSEQGSLTEQTVITTDTTETESESRSESESKSETATETTETEHTHEWLEATCKSPRTCTTCGETEGEIGDHAGGVAACMKKAICDTCGKEYGESGKHQYDAQITTNEYLKSSATLSAKAKYYYACSLCGKRGYTTYDVGETLLVTMTEKYKAYGSDGAEVEKFMFFTDPHYISAEENGTWSSGALKLLEGMKTYYDAFEPSFAISGGDWLNDSNSRANALEMLADIKTRTNELFGKTYLVMGNHDYNYQTRLDVPNTTTQSSHELTLEEKVAVWFPEYGSTYYSFDGENTKFYVFDTGKDWGHGSVIDYDVEQIIWYLQELEKNDDKHIGLIAHMVYLGPDVVHPAVLVYTEIANAYNNRQSYKYNGVTYDFSAKTGRVEFIMGGHEHADMTGYINDIAYVMTAAAKGSANGIAMFDIVCVDYEKDVIRLIRVATGEIKAFKLYEQK